VTGVDNIVLMGMKHCGKSTLGRMLAREKGMRYFDLDTIIEETYGNRSVPVREIYATRGKSYFQNLETEAVVYLVKQTKYQERIVAALGGGTIENSEAMEKLGHDWLLIYLQAPPRELFERIERGGLPPFLQGTDPYSLFTALYERRTSIYEKKADLTVNIGGRDLKESLNLLITSLKGIGYVWQQFR